MIFTKEELPKRNEKFYKKSFCFLPLEFKDRYYWLESVFLEYTWENHHDLIYTPHTWVLTDVLLFKDYQKEKKNATQKV